jgi:hypothetical protein
MAYMIGQLEEKGVLKLSEGIGAFIFVVGHWEWFELYVPTMTF